jgi:hypothetical protein
VVHLRGAGLLRALLLYTKFTIVKIEFTIVKIEFTIVKIEFTIVKNQIFNH